MPTGLGRSLAEFQRCPLGSEHGGRGPAAPTQIGSRQLRSSSAHCAQKLAKRWAKSWQVDMEVEAKMVEEKEEDEEEDEEEKKEKKEEEANNCDKI